MWVFWFLYVVLLLILIKNKCSSPIYGPHQLLPSLCLFSFFLAMNIMSPRFVLLVYLLDHDLIVEALFGYSYWNCKQCLYFKTQFLLLIFMHCFYCCVLSTLPVCFGSFYYLSFYSMKYHLLNKKRGKKKTSNLLLL